VYRQACKNAELEIGKILAVKDRNLIYGDKLILNLPTKTHWRLPSEYIYIENGLFALRDYMLIHRVESIALPALGCGNGGLDRLRVKTMIVDALRDFDIPVWVYEP
jgi:O-acetyl-ADP-ribose deacetylase (regulator of RNase III)